MNCISVFSRRVRSVFIYRFYSFFICHFNARICIEWSHRIIVSFSSTLIKNYQRRLFRSSSNSPSLSNRTALLSSTNNKMAPNLQSLLSSSETSVPLKSDTETFTMGSMSRNLSRSTLAELSKREQADNSVSITKENQLRVRLFF
jgi:hypothetical protein